MMKGMKETALEQLQFFRFSLRIASHNDINGYLHDSTASILSRRLSEMQPHEVRHSQAARGEFFYSVISLSKGFYFLFVFLI